MVIVIDTENPDSMKVLRKVMDSAMEPVYDRIEAMAQQMAERPVEEKKERDLLLTSTDLMKEFGVSRITLHNWHKQGLPYIKGAPNKYYRSEVDKFIAKHKTIRRWY